MSVYKKNLNKIVLIVAGLINIFVIGNTLFTGWSLAWPKVPGKVISEEIKLQRGTLQRSGYKQYLFFITYDYTGGGVPYERKQLVDVFDSESMCKAAKASYQNKTIAVYVNPADPKFSVINPANGFINALISTVFIVILTMFLLYILTRRSNFSEGLSSSPITPQW